MLALILACLGSPGENSAVPSGWFGAYGPANAAVDHMVALAADDGRDGSCATAAGPERRGTGHGHCRPGWSWTIAGLPAADGRRTADDAAVAAVSA